MVSLTFVLRYAFSQPGLVKEHIDEETMAGVRRYRPTYVFYAVAIAVGFLLPIAAVGLYLGIALYLGVPARTIRSLVRRA